MTEMSSRIIYFPLHGLIVMSHLITHYELPTLIKLKEICDTERIKRGQLCVWQDRFSRKLSVTILCSNFRYYEDRQSFEPWSTQWEVCAQERFIRIM